MADAVKKMKGDNLLELCRRTKERHRWIGSSSPFTYECRDCGVPLSKPVVPTAEHIKEMITPKPSDDD